MVNNVTAERIDGFRSIKNRIKPAKVMLGFLNTCFICLISKFPISGVNSPKGSLIQMQCDNSTLIINRFS